MNKIQRTLDKIPSVFVSFGTLCAVVIYSLYNNTFYQLLEYTINYVISNSILSQYLLKDGIYKLAKDIKPYIMKNGILLEAEELLSDYDKNNNVKDFNYLYCECKEIIYTYSCANIDKEQEKCIANVMDFIKFMSNLSKKYEKKCLPLDSIKQLNTEMSEFLQSYGSAGEVLSSTLIDPILMYLGTNENFSSFNPIFLSGNPGVGKTRFVKILAEKLNSHIEYFDIKKDTRLGRLRIHNDFAKEYENFNNVTKLISKSVKNQNKINILFIDEIDKILKNKDDESNYVNDTLLSILGSSKEKMFRDHYIGVDICVPRNIIIICASNKSLKQIIQDDEKYEALQSRFTEIHIPDMSTELQYKLCLKYLESPEEEEMKFIKEVVNIRKYHGMRELELFMNYYINKKKSISFLKNIKDVEDITTFRKKYIDTI